MPCPGLQIRQIFFILMTDQPPLFLLELPEIEKRFKMNNLLNINAYLLKNTCGVSRTRPKIRHKLSTSDKYESVKYFIQSSDLDEMKPFLYESLD